jgi:hypothetical protein
MYQIRQEGAAHALPVIESDEAMLATTSTANETIRTRHIITIASLPDLEIAAPQHMIAARANLTHLASCHSLQFAKRHFTKTIFTFNQARHYWKDGETDSAKTNAIRQLSFTSHRK